MGKLEEAIQRHKVEVRVSKQSGLTELKIRAMDNLAVSLDKKFSLEIKKIWKLSFFDSARICQFLIFLYRKHM